MCLSSPEPGIRSVLRFLLLTASALYMASPYAHTPELVTSGDVSVVPFPGHDTYVLSDQSATPSETAVLEIVIPGHTFGAPPHIHSKEDEHFYVLEGTVEFLDRDRTVSAGPGSLVVLPRGHLHGFWNLSDQPARMLLIITPGKFASFFDDVVAKVRAENPDDPAKVGALIAEMAAKYDVSVHPERIPASARPTLAK